VSADPHTSGAREVCKESFVTATELRWFEKDLAAVQSFYDR